MQCGFMRNHHQTKYALTDGFAKATATEHVLSEDFRSWRWVNAEENK